MARRKRLKRRPFLNDLPRRAHLTVKHHGWGELGLRLVGAPLRLLGLDRALRERLAERQARRLAQGWYRAEGRPVTVVIPTYGDPATTIECVKAVRGTVDLERVRIVVVDDGSPPEHRRALERLKGADVVLAERNAGYAASVNLGTAHAGERDDIVVLNSDVAPHRGWLESLQRAAYAEERADILGPRLLYPDLRIQSAGSHRHLKYPQWFDHRYRLMPRRHGPALVEVPAIAVTGACMYVKRAVLEAIGGMDEGYPMGYEDVDWCLRAWQAGFRVGYEPTAVLTHVESITRGKQVGEREQASQDRFWERWGEWFDSRDVRTPDGSLRVIYVTEDTGVGGGHRDVFEHLNRLLDRGHEVELYTLTGPPDWFPLRAPVRSFHDYESLTRELARHDAIKVATWWRTAEPVWLASVERGLPLFFVQDIETSYYGDDEAMQRRVLAGYREEFRYMTISQWNRERLRELRREAELLPPGIDLDTFRPLKGVERRSDVVLALGRSNPLKNLPLTIAAWERLDPRPELWMFGIEPELGPRHGARYIEAPSDDGVNQLMNEATVFVQTSRHEGFCLPPLEAMAAGAAVICTDAHGNRDFCRHDENCLLVDARPEAVSEAIRRVLADEQLRGRLVRGGLETVREYAWPRRIDELEGFLDSLATAPRRSEEPPARTPTSRG